MKQKRTAMQMMTDAVRVLSLSPREDNEIERIRLRDEMREWLDVVDPFYDLRRAR